MKKRRANRDTAALNSELIRRPIQRWFPLFLLPTFVAFCIGFLYPFCKGLFLSFCKFKLTSHWTWVGFDNYLRIFNDGGFVHAFWYTALFALVSLVIINVFAFMVAYALTQGIKGSNLFRTVFFMPNLIGGIVLGYIWSTLIDGVLIRFGTALALNTKAGFWGLIILLSWQQIGYMMIIYIAGLQAVPEDMLEAARIDGAGPLKVFFKIALPMAKPALVLTYLFSFIWIWNDTTQLPQYSTGAVTTLPMHLQQFVERFNKLFASVGVSTGGALNESIRLAGTLLTILPLIILYFIVQKQFVESIERTGLTGE